MLNQDAYTRAFEALLPSLSGSERDTRSAQLQRFFSAGLPNRSIETFKYSDFTALAEGAFALALKAPSPSLDAWTLPDCTQQLLINGHAATPTAALDGPISEPAHAGLAALNAAFATPGLQLQLERNVALEQPLHVLNLSVLDTPAKMIHLRHRIRLEAGASATVVLHDIGLGDAERWITQTLEIDLAANARLQLIRIQDESAATSGWFQATARIQRDASIQLLQFDFGGARIRNDLRLLLQGEGAECGLHGLFAPAGGTHVDNHTVIEHQAPHCVSREFFRGLAWDKAHAVFNGRIVVQPGAQKTDSEQRIANLVIGKGAEINAKPELEIHADDVKCAHGATFGQLDTSALFYLRTRGVPEATALSLLTFSFAADALQRISWPSLREFVTRRFLARMGGDLDAGELL
ncbi:Fe-S cluster assembly protein SufD [Sinimarinibacterium sp. CAU 1509]|uniref:Fe-S cluster assembly protein SufD n=1 Tax=Sinimarinibacterium sp. CAU 1509 TaxID=2562283 RepID=UPI0010AB91BF|nr:Fe-S cluster assembly protein SufD [Sinimarinibacterium sp. CAU 1509]TJY60905.1 Fe-S cluster assembly protein SufD [Sinimarinibacterium sp. CAU 1509]